MADTDLERETGTEAPVMCPNGCGTTLKLDTEHEDGATSYKRCRKCHDDPEQASDLLAEKAAAQADRAAARERGTQVEGD